MAQSGLDEGIVLNKESEMVKEIRKIVFISVMGFFYATSPVSFGQDQKTLTLSLDESISIALDRSYTIKSLVQSNIWADRNLWAAKAGYRTRIESNWYLPEYNEGFKLVEVVSGTPVAKQYGDFSFRGVLDIVQPMPFLPLGGGDLTFRSEAYQLNSWTPSQIDPAVNFQSNQFYTGFSIIFNKPLFTINEVALNLKQAELSYEKQSRIFKRSELDLVYNVTNAFFQLYRFSQIYEINKEQVKRQDEIYTTTLNKYKAGLIAEVEAMQAEVDLIQYQNELKSAESNLQRQEAEFKQLVGLPLDVKVSVATELTLKPVYVDLDKALALARENRSEIVEKEIDIENQRIVIKEVDARRAIQGSLTGYYRLAGFSEGDLPYGTSTLDLLESSWSVLKRTPNRGVTFNLEIPIFDWGQNKAQVDAEKANLIQDELEMENLYITIEREVRDVVRRVYESYDRVQMLEKSKEVSQKSFDISLQRFANGDITLTDLARASDQLNTAKLSYLSAYNDYKLSLADLRRKTLYDFEINRLLIE